MQELGLAHLHASFLNTKIDRKKSRPYQARDFYLFAEKSSVISTNAANAFFELAAESKLPAWVIAMAPLDNLKRGRDHRKATGIRALIGDGVILLGVTTAEERLFADFGLFEDGCGTFKLQDVDTFESYQVRVEGESQPYWAIEVEAEIC